MLRTTRIKCRCCMKKLFLFLFLVLGTGFVSSCGSDGDDEKTKEIGKEDSKKNLGGGIYIINEHKFVDLGLPSGLLWAETNIGAETAADHGNYYAWGETTTKSDYDWDTYKYGTSEFDITKYNKTDSMTVLENADDAACVNWGSYCRMPTYTEFRELLNSDNCTWTWTSMKNSSSSSINGYKVTSKKNGNSIFLPASGYRRGDDLGYHGSCGYYWSSTLYASDVYYAYGLCSFSSSRYTDLYDRYYGRAVRPVAAP